jgi:hypothetical protein
VKRVFLAIAAVGVFYVAWRFWSTDRDERELWARVTDEVNP